MTTVTIMITITTTINGNNNGVHIYIVLLQNYLTRNSQFFFLFLPHFPLGYYYDHFLSFSFFFLYFFFFNFFWNFVRPCGMYDCCRCPQTQMTSCALTIKECHIIPCIFRLIVLVRYCPITALSLRDHSRVSFAAHTRCYY